jgi:signal transduction histidine kinase/CheY-like chemotaxis protein
MKQSPLRANSGYVTGLAIFAAGLLLALASYRIVHQSPGALFLAAMMAAAWYGGRGPGVLVTLLSAAALQLYFFPSLGMPGGGMTAAATGTYAFVAFLVGWATDATRAAIRRAEAARDEAKLLEEQLRTALDAAEMRAFSWDLRTGDVRYSGHLPAPHAHQLVTTRGESEARLHPDDLEQVRQRVEEACQGGPYESVHRVVTPQGEQRWVLEHGQVARDPEGAAVRLSGVAVDITERVRLETALRDRTREVERQNEELETQREELEAQSEELLLQNEELADQDRRRNEFLAMLAHELRNPLAPIVAAAEAMRLRLASDPASERQLGIIARQSRHLSRLVGDLLDLSRITRGKIGLRREAADLGEIVEQALQTCEPLIHERRHELQVTLPPEPVPVDADATRLVQVVCNMLTNAARYTDPGGRIELTLRVVPLDPAAGDPGSASAPPAEAELSVRDTGRGIPPELLPRIFEPFVQAEQGLDRAEGGLGVGLTLVRTLVEMHGGSVTALSEGPGHGSEFVVRLPLLKDEGSVKDEGAPTGVRMDGRMTDEGGHSLPSSVMRHPSSVRTHPSSFRLHPSRAVLIVEDNRDAAETLRDLLQLWGYACEAASSGPEGLERARASVPALVLLDIGLPGFDGLEVARRLRADPALAEVPVVALTGYAQEEDRQRSREAGIIHHLAKPVDPRQLRTVLEQLIGGPEDRDARPGEEGPDADRK